MLTDLFLSVIFNSVVQILIATSLIFVWRRDRSHLFVKYLGNAYLANAFFFVFYVLYDQKIYIWHIAGIIGLIGTFFVYAVNMLEAVISLGGKKLKILYKASILGSLILVSSIELIRESPSTSHLVVTLFAVAIGMIATYWLWDEGGLQRLIGPLIIAGAGTGLIFIFWGDLLIQLQIYLVIIVRAALALVIIYISNDRSEAERLKLAELLHHGQKMEAVGQLASGVAHDFNNLLGGIMGAAELLKNYPATKEEQSEYLDIILKTTRRAAELTGQLLTFARKGNTAAATVDVADVISDTVSFLQRTIDKRITITVENSAECCIVAGDNSQLHNVFMNIGINASHAMPEGGIISFRLENKFLDENYCTHSLFDIEPGNYIQIEIRDNGCGMSAEVQKRIFEPFFTTKEQGKGTGLGLAAAYGAVQEHRGVITVYSEEHTGTVFHIYLPLSHDGELALNAEPEIIRGSGVILLVDDEETIRITAQAMLKSLGYEVRIAADGKDAVALFHAFHHEIDVVILDMNMPVMGGLETFKKMREINPGCRVIVSSGFSKNEDRDEMKKDGLAGFIHKPFQHAELSRIIAEVKQS